jgi:ribosome maturation factor RimP
MDTAERVRDLVAPLVGEAGADLYDVEFVQGTLRVTVDQPGGVGIDVIGRLTREISHLLDETDPIAGHYTLEVSSPGLERALRRPEHFASAVGTVISVKARPGIEGDRRIRGVLMSADADEITVAPEATPDAPRRLAIADIERARTVFEWGPAPKPGRPSPASSSKQKKAATS